MNIQDENLYKVSENIVDGSIITGVNHIAIVVPDLHKASELYRNCYGVEVSEQIRLPDHGVDICYVQLGNVGIELLHPVDANSPVWKFRLNHPRGGIHHICYGVNSIVEAVEHLKSFNIETISGIAIGVKGKPVTFLRPRDNIGILIELEEN